MEFTTKKAHENSHENSHEKTNRSDDDAEENFQKIVRIAAGSGKNKKIKLIFNDDFYSCYFLIFIFLIIIILIMIQL